MNDFIFWLVNKENTIKIYKDVGYLPVRESALNSLELKSFIREKPIFRIPIEELDYARCLPHHREYFKINQMLIDMLERIMFYEGDPLAELERTEIEINSNIE